MESGKRQIIEGSQVKTVPESGFVKLVKPLIAAAKIPAQPPTKSADGNELNYLVRVDLEVTSFPVICRVFSFPASLIFYHLHLVIQVAFDWQRCGQWAFMTLDPRIKHSYPITSTKDAYMCRKMEREDSDMEILPSPTTQDYID